MLDADDRRTVSRYHKVTYPTFMLNLHGPGVAEGWLREGPRLTSGNLRSVPGLLTNARQGPSRAHVVLVGTVDVHALPE